MSYSVVRLPREDCRRFVHQPSNEFSKVITISCIYDGSTPIATGTWDRGRKEQPWSLGQFAILVDSNDPKLNLVTGRWKKVYLCQPFMQYVGPWKLTIDVFGNLSIWKHYYDQTKNQLVPLNKGISFPLSYYRPLAREIYNLLERYPSLKHALAVLQKYSQLHSRSATFATRSTNFAPATKSFPIESLANWLYPLRTIFNIFRRPYSNNFYLFMSSFLWSSVLLFGIVFNKIRKWNLCCWNSLHKYLGSSVATLIRGSDAARGSMLRAPCYMLHAPIHAPCSVLRILRAPCAAPCSMLYAPCSLHAPCSMLRAPCSLLHAPCSVHCATCSVLPVLHALCSMLSASCSVLRALCYMLRAPCSVLHALCSMLRAPCSVLRAPGSVLRAASCVMRGCAACVRS